MQNEIISHQEMCYREGLSLQRGMNFRSAPATSILLSSHRPGAPYEDRLDEEGMVLIYEGHDEPRSATCPNPKEVDQPATTRFGRLTQNGLFEEAAQRFASGDGAATEVRVYEKIKPGIWSYNGLFTLEDSWTETVNSRRVYRFKLRLLSADSAVASAAAAPIEHARLIPSAVKLAVWKRDKGACAACGSVKNLHFDHILPYSKGGVSTMAENIQLLCARHNLEKSAHIL